MTRSWINYNLNKKTHLLYFSAGLLLGFVLLATLYNAVNFDSIFGRTNQVCFLKINKGANLFFEYVVARFYENERIELNIRSDELETSQSVGNKKRKVVIILTFMRSGSTFLGEIFNNHPDRNVLIFFIPFK